MYLYFLSSATRLPDLLLANGCTNPSMDPHGNEGNLLQVPNSGRVSRRRSQSLHFDKVSPTLDSSSSLSNPAAEMRVAIQRAKTKKRVSDDFDEIEIATTVSLDNARILRCPNHNHYSYDDMDHHELDSSFGSESKGM